MLFFYVFSIQSISTESFTAIQKGTKELELNIVTEKQKFELSVTRTLNKLDDNWILPQKCFRICCPLRHEASECENPVAGGMHIYLFAHRSGSLRLAWIAHRGEALGVFARYIPIYSRSIYSIPGKIQMHTTSPTYAPKHRKKNNENFINCIFMFLFFVTVCNIDR